MAVAPEKHDEKIRIERILASGNTPNLNQVFYAVTEKWQNGEAKDDHGVELDWHETHANEAILITLTTLADLGLITFGDGNDPLRED